MEIKCELRENKNKNGFYLYIPLIEKFVFLEKVEQKLIALLMDGHKLNDKSETK